MSIRVAHIKNSFIANVSLASDDWIPPEDGSQMTEAQALQAGFTRLQDHPVPDKVSMTGMRLALVHAGLESVVKNAIYGAPESVERDVAVVWWETASEVERTHPLVQQLISSLQLETSQIDSLFIEAEKLVS